VKKGLGGLKTDLVLLAPDLFLSAADLVVPAAGLLQSAAVVDGLKLCLVRHEKIGGRQEEVLGG
jgi:hypothetical protein